MTIEGILAGAVAWAAFRLVWEVDLGLDYLRLLVIRPGRRRGGKPKAGRVPTRHRSLAVCLFAEMGVELTQFLATFRQTLNKSVLANFLNEERRTSHLFVLKAQSHAAKHGFGCSR
jgi:hypothetical protein